MMSAQLLRVAGLALLQVLFIHTEDAVVATASTVSDRPSLRGSCNRPHCSDCHKKSHRCYNLYSDMAFNPLLQSFKGNTNPDSMAKGFATCKLCTDGTMTCDANIYGGKTTNIASHIYYATKGDGKMGNSPPKINLCGSNDPGMINDGTPYMEGCAMYSENGNSANANMKGAQVMSTSDGQSIEDLVNDIGNYPERYYMNFHSIASWSYWLMHGGDPKGMCRGVMKLSLRMLM